MHANSSGKTTLVSAPGKVLVTGGYLVLDRQHNGLVVGTNACMYSAIQTQTLPDTSADRDKDIIPVYVLSPQFKSAWWKYTFNIATKALTQYASADGGQNKFVHLALENTLALTGALKLQQLSTTGALKIVLCADNDFYSQRETLTKMGLDLCSESLQRLPRMCETGTTLGDVHKTGMGSSAAMVTSLVAAILVHLGAVELADSKSLQLVHNISQYAHCLAQGKVGSGFDVSAAVYGSHVYRRFSPAVLEPAMPDTRTISDIRRATSPENPGWDSEVVPVETPPRFVLRMADVDTGSNTPSMVRKVLGWKQQNPAEATRLWDALGAANASIRQLWDALVQAHSKNPDEYNQAVDWCAQNRSSEWSRSPHHQTSATSQHLVSLVAAINDARDKQRQIGTLANVSIEPPEQTSLLDACMEVPGVCMAAVPGAGGYDAIFCVALGSEASKAVESLWSTWTDTHVGPLLASQASSGVRVLDPSTYPEIINRF